MHQELYLMSMQCWPLFALYLLSVEWATIVGYYVIQSSNSKSKKILCNLFWIACLYDQLPSCVTHSHHWWPFIIISHYIPAYYEQISPYMSKYQQKLPLTIIFDCLSSNMAVSPNPNPLSSTCLFIWESCRSSCVSQLTCSVFGVCIVWYS